MRTYSRNRVLVLSAAATVLACSAFTYAEEKAMPPMSERPAQQAMTEGAIAVETTTASYTIESIDKDTRAVTLKGEDGKTHTLKAGKEVRNFDQIKVGDKVNATLTDEIAVAVRPAGSPPSNMGQANMIALAPKGAKPGVIMARTDEITCKIVSVDAASRTLTFETPAGQSKTIKVAPRVNLDTFKTGDDVTLQWAQALAVIVQSPEARPAGGMQQPTDNP